MIEFAREIKYRLFSYLESLRYRGKTNRETFQKIYENRLWGNSSQQFYSGPGSHDVKVVDPFVKDVLAFLKSLPNSPIVIDLGCGDFNVGSKLFEACHLYIACDVVPELIEYNKVKFVNKSIDFRCVDIVKDELPKGEVVIIRQVLQHLSNADIALVLPKLTAFKYLIITEHIPVGNFVPNLDKPSGLGIRMHNGIKKDSGVVITEPPFNFKASSVQKLQTTICDDQSQLVTWLFMI
jgi:hypothetical protein